MKLATTSMQSANTWSREGGLAPDNEVLHVSLIVEERTLPLDNTDIWHCLHTSRIKWYSQQWATLVHKRFDHTCWI